MKMLPFFMLIFSIFSCSRKDNKQQEKVPAAIDSIIPLFDTSIVPSNPYDHDADSIYIQRQRDSFYSIKPEYVFTTTGNISSFDKLTAAAMDTSKAITVNHGFTLVESYTYNKDSMPLSKTATYSGRNYTIKVVTKDLEDYQQKQIFINDKRMIWGRDIDLSLTRSDISYAIALSPEDCKLIRFRGKEFLYLQGYIEKCNGKGCNVNYYLLYDPVLRKAIAVEQYMSRQLNVGKFGTNSQLGFLVFDNYDQNYLYQCFPVAAKAYLFSENGKIIPAKNKQGKQYYFDGYVIANPDSIRIIKANFP